MVENVFRTLKGKSMEKSGLFQPVGYTVAGAICKGQEYIMVKATGEPDPHISVMRFTAGEVVVEAVGEKCADVYFSVEMTPYGALVSHEERIVFGSHQYARIVDSTFFFAFSPEWLEKLNGILVGDNPVAEFYAVIWRPIPDWLRTGFTVSSRRSPRLGISGLIPRNDSEPPMEILFGRDLYELGHDLIP